MYLSIQIVSIYIKIIIDELWRHEFIKKGNDNIMHKCKVREEKNI